MTTSPKNIALLGPSHPWRGGIAHYNARLFQALLDADHNVQLWNFQALYPEFLFPGKTQYDNSQTPIDVPNEAIYHPVLPYTWLHCIQRLVADSIDIVVLQWWHPYFAPGYLAMTAATRALGIDTVMICHNVEPHEKTVLDSALLYGAFSTPHRFIVQSSQEKQVLQKYVRNDRKIDVVSHPPYDIFNINSSEISPELARQAWDIQAERALLFFGLVRPYKGLESLLQAMALLPESLDIELLVVGEFYDSIEKYERLIAQAGIKHRVRLCDSYISNEEIPILFQAIDCCILPYHHATGSGIANIARDFGKPMIMSDLSGLREGFSDYAPLMWTKPADKYSIAEAIEQFCKQDLLSNNLDTNNLAPHSQKNIWQPIVTAITGEMI